MIRISKPVDPPDVLAGEGARKARALCDAYSRDPAGFDNGEKTFSFDASLYGHPTVKGTLISAQHDKCAFCEAKISHISFGDVEHFRPKAGYRQLPEEPLGRPGYYWLAYEWSNLYLACQLCNQRFKKNAFPLASPSRRCPNHLGDLAGEDPMFLDPGTIDPEAHITFSAEQPVARPNSLQGEATIEALGLRREPLRERRFDRYQILVFLRKVIKLLPGELEGREASELLAAAVRDDAEYAAMARALLTP